MVYSASLCLDFLSLGSVVFHPAIREGILEWRQLRLRWEINRYLNKY